MGEKAAKDFYLSLWKLFIDSRNRDRKAKMRPLNSRFRKPKKKESEPVHDQDENKDPASIGDGSIEAGNSQEFSIKYYTKDNIF